MAAGDGGVTPACGVGAAAAGAWADGMTVGRDVEAGRQEGHALSPEILRKLNEQTILENFKNNTTSTAFSYSCPHFLDN